MLITTIIKIAQTAIIIKIAQIAITTKMLTTTTIKTMLVLTTTKIVQTLTINKSYKNGQGVLDINILPVFIFENQNSVSIICV